MTLVVGSPGAGKTAVLTDWLTHHPGAVAWLSCDPTDADPIRFWSALAQAIQRVVPGAGGDALKHLEEHGDETADMAARLANDCEFAPDLVIVVDDFHHARPAPAVFSAFVRSLPAGVRLVLASRHDPSFPVGRLRVQGRLLELRDEDLRFSVGEAGELFANLGIEIVEDDLGRLCALTEGWAAGLQLAALSLAARPDADGLVQTFAASDRGVSDLLLNEVIDLQPPDVADFLMATSVLESFDATICDAVTGRDDSAEFLGRLHQNHLFVIALDRGAGWYRYHHLFSAFLQARLRATSRQRYRDAHADAARAFAAVGDSLTAVEHAMKADDVAGALDLLTGLLIETDDFESRLVAIDTVRAWLRHYGTQQTDADPNAVLVCCMVLTALGAAEEADGWLRRVDQRAGGLTTTESAFLTGLWGFLALHRGDPESAIDLLSKSQDIIGDDVGTHHWLSMVPAVVCHAHLLLGDSVATQDAIQQANHASFLPPFVEAVRLPGIRAWAAVVRGDLTEGAREADQVVELARSMKLDDRNVALVLPQLSLAAIARERDEVDAANVHVELALARARGSGRPPFIFMCALEQVRLALALGDRDRACELLERARSIMPAATGVVIDQVDRVEAFIAVASGDRRAGELVERLLPSLDETFLRVRLALADGDATTARQLLEAAGDATLTRRQRIEQELLLARAVAGRDRTAATTHLDIALRLAEPEGMVRIVLDEGPGVHALLDALPTDARLARFVAAVLDNAHRRAAPAGHGSRLALVEPLSERELGVLRYLASRLTYGEMAGHLFISVNTLKTHLKAVYRKLGASTRAEAVEIARRSGIL